MKPRTKNDLGLIMDGEPALFDLDIPENHVEPVKKARPAFKPKPWLTYIGHGRCHKCIDVSAHDRTRIAGIAAWQRPGRHGVELACDIHRERF